MTNTILFASVVVWCILLIECTVAETKLAPYTEFKPQTQSAALREALYGGTPYLIFCKTNDAQTGQSSFIDQVREKVLEQDSDSDLRTALVDCDAPVGTKSNGKSLKDAFKLGKIKDTVTILWCVNGAKPVRLDHKYYATIMKDSKGSATGQAKLNPSKLAKYVAKYGVPTVLKLKSNATFRTDCAAAKYQTCAIAVHMGNLKPGATNAIKRIAKLFRSVRVYTLDALQYNFSILDKLPKVTADTPQLVVIKKRTITHSSLLQKLSGDPIPDSLDNEICQDTSDQVDSAAKDDCDVDQNRHIISLSKAHGALSKLKEGTSHEQIHSVFSAGQVDSKREVLEDNFKLVHSNHHDLVFKISVKTTAGVHEGIEKPRVAYFLDWHAMQPYLVSQTVFSKQLSIPKIAGLQRDTWSRAQAKRVAKSKSALAVSAKAFRGDLSSRKETRKFFEDLMAGNLQLAPLSSVPTLKSKSTPKKSAKPSTKSKRTQSKTSSKKPKRDKANGKTAAGPSQEQIELERQQRMEMDKEAQQFFAEYTGGEDVDESNDLEDELADDEVVDLDELDDDDDEVIELDDEDIDGEVEELDDI